MLVETPKGPLRILSQWSGRPVYVLKIITICYEKRTSDKAGGLVKLLLS